MSKLALMSEDQRFNYPMFTLSPNIPIRSEVPAALPGDSSASKLPVSCAAQEAAFGRAGADGATCSKVVCPPSLPGPFPLRIDDCGLRNGTRDLPHDQSAIRHPPSADPTREIRVIRGQNKL